MAAGGAHQATQPRGLVVAPAAIAPVMPAVAAVFPTVSPVVLPVFPPVSPVVPGWHADSDAESSNADSDAAISPISPGAPAGSITERIFRYLSGPDIRFSLI